MTQRIELFSKHPDDRVLGLILEALRDGAVIAYPTDSGYALGCRLGEKSAVDRIVQIRQLGKNHPLTLMCHDLSSLSLYAEVDTATFRILKRHMPGEYTFILNATREVPKLLLQPGKKTIGLRISDHPIPLLITEHWGAPILSSTLILPDQKEPLKDADEVIDALGGQIELVIEGGYCGFEQTSVVDLTGKNPVVLREGSGDIREF